ncbi:MAG TPA: anti-sigma factor [Rhodanobacteraceae bacterium]|nr:anti-sigma factor [Rhodanobacteraceae bacterium]
MDCKEAARLLEPYLDGELDRDEVRALEAHVDGCAECQAALAQLGRVRHALRADAPRFSAPASLRERIRRESAAPASVTRMRRPPSWMRLAAACFGAFVAGAAVMHFAGNPGADTREQAARDLFASHWRALAAASPVDVVSSDKHTVRPWFAGKVAQSPRVTDFADQGFPLVGGRVDYVGSARVPVLVYRHDKHLIDVYVLPSGTPAGATAQRDGYSLIWGTLDGERAAIVSDLDAGELARFEGVLTASK